MGSREILERSELESDILSLTPQPCFGQSWIKHLRERQVVYSIFFIKSLFLVEIAVNRIASKVNSQYFTVPAHSKWQ